MIENENINNSQTATERIVEEYQNEINKKNREIELLNDKLAEISTVSYSAGTPQVKYNRGDESNDFAFPVKWAQTCKKMETSIYLEPVLQFYKTTFNTFNYELEMPSEAEENKAVRLAYEFIIKQFERAGGLKNLIVNIAYNTLVYGFAFFTPKLEIVNGQKYQLKGKLDGLKGFKYYDPTQIYNFVFKEKDADELQAITLLTSPKLLGGSLDNKGYMLEDYYNEWAQGNFENAKFVKIDFDLMLGGYATYGNITGDIIGRPFLYSAYPLWQVLESMDNSFNRNLSNIGEHSFNFVSTSSEPISDTDRSEIKKELQEWVNKKGGIFLSKYGKVEKIECIDANEWWQFRDSMLSTLFKNKGLDIKALGLNRGATKDLASFAQTDSVLMANDIMENIIMSINNTFMKRYFDLNFKELRMFGDCDYFKIKHSIPEAQQKQSNNNFNVSMSGTDDIPDGSTWKTLENGKHVLVKDGKIISRAGIENWKNTGKKKSKENKKENKQYKSGKGKVNAEKNGNYKEGWEQAIKSEYHDTFKNLNECKKPAAFVINNELLEDYGIAEDEICDLLNRYDYDKDDVFFSLHHLYIDNEGEQVDIVHNEHLNDVEKFLYDYTLCRDIAFDEWDRDGKLDDVLMQTKLMIDNSPEVQGELWRGEDTERVNMEVGETINFDCRSTSDNNTGWETVNNFIQESYENGSDVVLYKFPKGTRGLNIQGLSPYINQNEYLVDGNFVIANVEEDEYGRKIVELDFIK